MLKAQIKGASAGMTEHATSVCTCQLRCVHFYPCRIRGTHRAWSVHAVCSTAIKVVCRNAWPRTLATLPELHRCCRRLGLPVLGCELSGACSRTGMAG